MHDDRFDTLAREVWTSETRRRLIRRLAVLPLIGSIVTLMLEDEEVEAEHPVRRIQRRRAQHRRRVRRRRQRRRERDRCDNPCGCPPGSRRLCGGNCVDTDTNALHCGHCGNRCPIFAVCQQGRCVCNDCPATPWQCCAPGSGGCSICGLGTPFYGDPLSCENSIEEEDCPPAQRCVGETTGCAVCCPAGTTCDPSTGWCVR
jgi:hypothetical protein